MNERDRWLPVVQQLEQQYQIPTGLLASLVENESGWRTQVRSPVGAIGLGQLMPGTAKSLGVDPFNPQQNLKGAAMYLSQQLRKYKGNVAHTLAAYNAGPGAVDKYGGVPPYDETRNYIKKVTGTWQKYKGVGGAQQTRATPAPTPRTVPSVYDVDPGRVAKIQHAWSDAPDNAGLRVGREYEKAAASAEKAARVQAANDRDQRTWAAQQSSTTGNPYGGGVGANEKPGGWYKTPNGWVQAKRGSEANWQFLQRLGTKGFGLRNDPGNNQTTGGGHRAGSLHYSQDAIDFGNGLNDEALLQTWFKWLDARRRPLGIQELLLEDPGTSNHHVHVGLGG